MPSYEQNFWERFQGGGKRELLLVFSAVWFILTPELDDDFRLLLQGTASWEALLRTNSHGCAEVGGTILLRILQSAFRQEFRPCSGLQSQFRNWIFADGTKSDANIQMDSFESRDSLRNVRFSSTERISILWLLVKNITHRRLAKMRRCNTPQISFLRGISTVQRVGKETRIPFANSWLIKQAMTLPMAIRTRLCASIGTASRRPAFINCCRSAGRTFQLSGSIRCSRKMMAVYWRI